MGCLFERFAFICVRLPWHKAINQKHSKHKKPAYLKTPVTTCFRSIDLHHFVNRRNKVQEATTE